MTLDAFTSELARAAGRLALHPNGRMVVPDIGVSPRADLPESVVYWETDGPDDCRLSISPLLVVPARIRYSAQRLSGVWPMLEAYYAHAARSFSPPRGRANINVDDHSVVPGLSFCSNDRTHILIPDAHFIGARGYAETRRFYANGGVPWRCRKPLAIWRGATTGNSPAGWRGLPRIKLCELSRQYPDLLDAGISSVVQLPPDAEGEIREAGLMAKPIDVNDFGAWRIQIDIDGNTNSWPGLFQKLLTGSPVVKIESAGGWRQWYYDRLKPWENYVPAKANFSDLAEKLSWLLQHESEAAAIGMAGRDLALSITYESAIRGAVPEIVRAIAPAN